MKIYILFIGVLLMCSCSSGFNSDKFEDLTIDLNTSIPLGVFSVNDDALFPDNILAENSDGVLSAIFTDGAGKRTLAAPMANSQTVLSVDFDMEGIRTSLGKDVNITLTNPSIMITVTGVTVPINIVLNAIEISGGELRLKKETKFLVTESQNTIIINDDLFQETKDLSTSINNLLKPNSPSSPTISLTITPSRVRGTETFNLANIGYITSLEIPLEGTFGGIVFNESFEAGLETELGGDGLNVETISYAILADNQFPFDITLELYEADAEGIKGDQIGDETIVIAAADNDKPKDGAAITSRETRSTIIKLKGVDADRFMEAEYLAFDIKASSKGVIKLYKGYELELRMVIGLTGDLIVDEL